MGGRGTHHLPVQLPCVRSDRQTSPAGRIGDDARREGEHRVSGEARATRRQARGGRASYKAPRSGGVQGRRDVAANAPGSGGPARCEHARDVGGDERGDVHVVCGRIRGVRRVARASYGATTAPLGATKRPNWRESPKNRFSGGASVHKSRHVCSSWRQPDAPPRHRGSFSRHGRLSNQRARPVRFSSSLSNSRISKAGSIPPPIKTIPRRDLYFTRDPNRARTSASSSEHPGANIITRV